MTYDVGFDMDSIQKWLTAIAIHILNIEGQLELFHLY